MNVKVLKYATVLSGPVIGIVSLTQHGWLTFALPLYAFGLIPLLELLLPPDNRNLSDEQEKRALATRSYDYLLYAMVPLQYLLLLFFLFTIRQPGLTLFEITGRTLSMGIACGVLGINIGHELGHRSKKYEQVMAKALLLTSLYMHFFIEHNRGHHKKVSTDEDPASARYGEIVYTFWIRSIILGYISAWKLETQRLKKKGITFFSIHNEMIRFTVIQISFVALIYFLFGGLALLCFAIAAFIGILLLETVNYIEHYGLRRKLNDNGGYERVMPVHSWNSNHTLGRIILFELSRHSDHHFKASRKYQILRHFDNSPQMPTGYPGMVMLALVPPLWIWIMNRQIKKFKEENAGHGIALG